MTMPDSVEELLSIARDYWPSDLESYLRPERSPQVARFQALWRQELAKMDQWEAFLLSLGEALPEFTIGNATTTSDACFRCGVYPKRDRNPPNIDWVVVGCVSILVPAYTIYGVQYEYRGGRRIKEEVFFEPLPDGMRVSAGVMARSIEATFGVSPLPRELAETPVPLFVDPQKPPNTTLFHALFASQPASVP